MSLRVQVDREAAVADAGVESPDLQCVVVTKAGDVRRFQAWGDGAVCVASFRAWLGSAECALPIAEGVDDLERKLEKPMTERVWFGGTVDERRAIVAAAVLRYGPVMLFALQVKPECREMRFDDLRNDLQFLGKRGLIRTGQLGWEAIAVPDELARVKATILAECFSGDEAHDLRRVCGSVRSVCVGDVLRALELLVGEGRLVQESGTPDPRWRKA